MYVYMYLSTYLSYIHLPRDTKQHGNKLFSCEKIDQMPESLQLGDVNAG